MERLAAKGVTFSIDDFGKGYSNLGNFSKFEVATLKIDQSFVFSMFDTQQNTALPVNDFVGFLGIGVQPRRRTRKSRYA